MCYAISSETQDLVRPGAEADTRAYVQLYPLADKRMLGRILHPRLMHSYFATLARAVLCAFTYGNIIGCHLGEIPHPDSVSLVADLLLRHERMGWCIVTGVWQGDLYVSLRAMPDRAHAGVVLARILRKIGRAGGHGTMAAGRVPLKSPEPGERERLEKEIVLRLVRALHRRTEVTLRPLVSPEELGAARKREPVSESASRKITYINPDSRHAQRSEASHTINRCQSATYEILRFAQNDCALCNLFLGRRTSCVHSRRLSSAVRRPRGCKRAPGCV